MALSKDLRQEIIKADRSSSYSLFSGEVLLSEDYTLFSELGNDLTRYESLELDTHVAAVMRKRKMGVTSREWRVDAADPEREEDQEVAALVKRCLELFNFDEMCLHLLNAILVGHGEAEIIWAEDTIRGIGDIVRPVEVRGKESSRFRFAKPKDGKENPNHQYIKGYELRVVSNSTSWEGNPVPKNKIVHHSYGSKSGNPNGRGEGSVLWWMVRFKKEVVKSWLIFLDKFASPTPLGTFPLGGDQRALEQFLDQISQGAWAAIPEGYRIEFLEAQRSGSISTYKDFEEWCDAQISKCVLGETLTTELGDVGSQAATQTHNDVRTELAKADADLLSYNLRDYLLLPIVKLNRPKMKPPSVWRVFDERVDLQQRSSIDRTLFDMGFRLTIEKVIEIYGDGYIDTQAEDGDDLESILGGDEVETPDDDGATAPDDSEGETETEEGDEGEAETEGGETEPEGLGTPEVELLEEPQGAIAPENSADEGSFHAYLFPRDRFSLKEATEWIGDSMSEAEFSVEGDYYRIGSKKPGRLMSLPGGVKGVADI